MFRCAGRRSPAYSRAPRSIAAKGEPSPLPDQRAIDANPLKTQTFIQGHCRQIEIIHEERDPFSFSENVSADFTQRLMRMAAPAEIRVCPNAHELHDVIRHRGELALRNDRAVDDKHDRALTFNELANALAISDRIAFERIDSNFFFVHRRARGNELIEIARR